LTYKIDIEKFLSEEDELVGPPLVISLEKDAERWSSIVTHLSKWNIKPEKFTAICDIDLPKKSLTLGMQEFSSKVNVCTNLSHAGASRYRLFQSSHPFWLVLEDDCRFLEDPRNKILSILGSLIESKIDWSIISLGSYCTQSDIDNNKRLTPDYSILTLEQPTSWFPYGAHSYLINRNYSEDLISKWSSCLRPCDNVLHLEYRNKKGYLLRPSLTYQEEYPSNRSLAGRIYATKKTADIHPDLVKKIL